MKLIFARMQHADIAMTIFPRNVLLVKRSRKPMMCKAWSATEKEAARAQFASDIIVQRLPGKRAKRVSREV